MEQKLVKPDDRINTHNGEHKILGKLIKDIHPFEYLNIEDVIMLSLSIGIVEITKELNASDIYDRLMKYGFASIAL